MKVAVCDNDVEFLKELTDLIDSYIFDRNVMLNVKKFTDYESLLNQIDDFDIFFLDYKMDGIDGLSFARKLAEKYGDRKRIVFVTAYPEIVYEAFEVRAFRFLVKPIEREKLYRTLDDLLMTTNLNPKITVKTDGETHYLEADEIHYLKVERKNTSIVLDKKEIVCHKTMDYFEEKLSCCSVFFRIHRSYLINVKKVKSFKNTYVIMQNGDKIEMSRRRYNDFCKRYADICE